jgi:RNA polymerase sigma factor (sigma-70 family)
MGDGLDVARSAAVRRCQSAGATAEEAEDSVHDALLTLLESPDAAPVHKPGAWIATVSHRRWVDHVRRGTRERVVLRRDHAMKEPDLDPADVVADRDQAQWLVASLKALPKTTQEICWAVGRGMSQDEVAEDFGLTPRSVESHLTRARRLLRGLRIVAIVPALTLADRVLRRWPGVPEVAAVAMPVAVCVAVTMAPPPHSPPPPPSITIQAPQDVAATTSVPPSDPPAPAAPAVSVPPLPVTTASVPPEPATTTASPTAEPENSAAAPEIPAPKLPGPKPSVPKLPVKPLLSSLPTIPALPPILPHPIAPGRIVESLVNGLPIHLPLR